MPFYVLIDYDNLLYSDKRNGLIYVVDKIVKKFSTNEIVGKNITVRLYGGWFNHLVRSQSAVNLIAEISADFPRALTLADGASVIVNVELAVSLTIAPTKNLFNTFRTRGAPSGLKSRHPTSIGCHDGTCPIIHVHEFISNNSCGKCGKFGINDLLFRNEQKLVDTMLTADMIMLSNSNPSLCIVSSDEDFWPGILSSISLGTIVYHIHTKGNGTPSYYSSTTTNKNYVEKKL